MKGNSTTLGDLGKRGEANHHAEGSPPEKKSQASRRKRWLQITGKQLVKIETVIDRKGKAWGQNETVRGLSTNAATGTRQQAKKLLGS